MISGFRHVGLVVSDLESSLNFWIDVMGFEILRRMEEKGAHIDAMLGLDNVEVTTVKLSGPDQFVLELLFFKSHPDQINWGGRPFSTGLTHVAFTVDNIEAVCDRLSEFGASAFATPQTSPDGLVKAVYVAGPEGVLIELVEVSKNEL